ncbi:MAG: mevalonate kinase [Chloroflexota bacterium]|nr:mevalonate kinase [Chloroflexota bacterium]
MMDEPVTARAPAKVILFGEHAINRGQPALAASVGLYATCHLARSEVRARFREGDRREEGARSSEAGEGTMPFPGGGSPVLERFQLEHRQKTPGEALRAGGYVFRSGAHGRDAPRVATAGREDLLRLAREVDAWRAAEDYESIRRLAGTDFYAPAKYILATALGEALPEGSLPQGLSVSFDSEIPRSGGLGSGGAAFASLACALAAWTGTSDPERIAGWAHRGDVIAHGGLASRLDTQTSLRGGVIRFLAQAPTGGLGEPVPCARGLTLVIGNTNVVAATSEVNSRVRAWLAASPVARMRYFEAIGVLSRAALEPLRTGDWDHIGHLMTLNQLLLEKIGVSSPEIERLIATALEAGALGAKLAGSGGGGIVIALTTPDDAPAVADALTRAGGAAVTPPLGVPGAAVEAEPDRQRQRQRQRQT